MTTEQAEAKLAAAQAAFDEARRNLYEALADRDDVIGDFFSAKWHRAIAHHDHATADRCYLEDQARKVLAGGEPYGDLSEARKAQIMAEVERLRSEGSGPREVGASD